MFTLPDGIFKVEITPERVNFFEWAGEEWRNLDPADSSVGPLGLLTNLYFPPVTLKRIEERKLNSYLNVLGVIEGEALEREETPETYGATLRFPGGTELNIIVTRSHDIYQLSTSTKYLDLGAGPVVPGQEYDSTKATAEMLYNSTSGYITKLFGVERGLTVFDFLSLPEDKDYIYVFGPEGKVREFESRWGARYEKRLIDLLRG